MVTQKKMPEPSYQGQASVNAPSLLTNKFKIFDQPFAHHLLNPRADQYCSWCLRLPSDDQKLLKCGACQFCYYCSSDCQKRAWAAVHRNECRRLKAVFPNLPMTEVMFLSKVLDRVLFLSEHGDEHGWEKERTFASLLGHEADIRADSAKMAHFEKLLGKMTSFRGSEMVARELFFDVFCKVAINSHSIHSNAGVEIGMALDLGISKYNHSCRPTCAMVFDGIRVFFRPLLPNVDVSDLDNAFISYVDVGRSRYRRRIDLKAKWYFDCECERCSDPEEIRLTALRCPTAACDGAILTTEEEEPMNIACPRCKRVCDEDRVKAAQQLMRELPPSFDPDCPAELRKPGSHPANPEYIEGLLVKARELLHESNVYVTRLQTALLHVKGELESALTSMHKTIYSNYKMCFPKADRHLGYSLLNIVKSLITQGKRKEAVIYAYEAMTIFEVCLGLEHPFYLQSLALWTYLEKEIPKTDEELLRLTKYGDNKPVDVTTLLEKVEITEKA